MSVVKYFPRIIHGRNWCLGAALLFGAAALTGCASRGRQAIPSGASVVESGTGTIDFEAKRDGDVWVYDADTGRLIYMGEVRKDQTVRVNAKSDQITIGGKTVSERPISDEHKYQIFFRRD
jgi:streptogramin lyase